MYFEQWAKSFTEQSTILMQPGQNVFRVGGSLSLVGGVKNIQLGVWGALLAPQCVQGKALVGVQGAKPPEAPGFQHI